MNKPWWQYLLEALASLWTGQQLQQAGATPAEVALAPTIMVTLPTFSGPVGAPPGLEESRDLAHCHPELQRRYGALKAEFRAQTGHELFETCTYRSVARQQQLYAQGRTAPGNIVTKLDGVTKKSRHNVYPAEAVDVCVDMDPGPGKHIVWDHSSYLPLGDLALKHGLIWGGGWVTIHDDPHLELPAGAA